MNFIGKKLTGKATEVVENHIESNKKTYVTGAVCLVVGYILGTRRPQPVHNLIVKL